MDKWWSPVPAEGLIAGEKLHLQLCSIRSPVKPGGLRKVGVPVDPLLISVLDVDVRARGLDVPSFIIADTWTQAYTIVHEDIVHLAEVAPVDGYRPGAVCILAQSKDLGVLIGIRGDLELEVCSYISQVMVCAWNLDSKPTDFLAVITTAFSKWLKSIPGTVGSSIRRDINSASGRGLCSRRSLAEDGSKEEKSKYKTLHFNFMAINLNLIM